VLAGNQERIRRQNECLLTLRETAFSLMHERDVDALLRLIVEKAAALGESSHAYLYTLTDDGEAMELKVVIGTAIREIGFRQRRGEGVVGRVWNAGKPLVIHDYDKWDDRVDDKSFDVIRTSTGFPLIVGGEVPGFSASIISIAARWTSTPRSCWPVLPRWLRSRLQTPASPVRCRWS
jgi:hypothetical protein